MAAPRFGDPNRPASSKPTFPTGHSVNQPINQPVSRPVKSVRQMYGLERLPAEPYRNRLVARRAGTPADTIVHAFRPKQKPLWLVLLIKLQQGSSIVTLLLMIAILSVYGWTVYLQQRWGQQYDKLETLKKRERQLTSANEVLKNQMAEQAEKPTAGLLLPDPSNAIFLTPAPPRPEVKPELSAPSTEGTPNRPLGY